MGTQNIAYPGAPKQMGQNAFQPQQYFPMPQGNVYTIEQPEEVNSVPCGTGVGTQRNRDTYYQIEGLGL